LGIGVKQVIVAGKGREAERCCGFFEKYGFDARILKPARKNAESIRSAGCPIVAAGGRAAGQKLRGMGVREDLLIEGSMLWAEDAERLIDALSFNSEARPNEYLQCLLENYPQSARDMIGTLADYQIQKIKKDIDPEQKTLAIYYPSKAYRSNLGSEHMRRKIRNEGFNVINLFGVIRRDGYEKQPYSYYAGHDLVQRFDFVDVFIYPSLMGGLPKRSKKVLFVHDIYDSPSGKDEAPVESATASDEPQHISPLLDELDYVFLPCRALMGRTQISVTKYIRSRPLWRIPGGYIKLDRNLRYFESHKTAVDSLIYAPTVCEDVFEDYVSVPRHGGDIVAALLENFPDYRIIFRPHPHTLETEYVKRIERRFRNNERFSFDPNASFYMDNYCRSAAMVTDMSGTAFTYAFTTLRPVVFFSHNEDTVEDTFNNVRYFRDRQKIGYIATTIDELAEKMGFALQERDGFKERIREFRDCEIFNVGNAEGYFASTFRHIFDGTVHRDWAILLSADYQTRGRLDTRSPSEAERNVSEAGTGTSEPHLIEDGYRGFNIIRCAEKYYGLAQSEGVFDVGKANRGEYQSCFVGNSVDEVKRVIVEERLRTLAEEDTESDVDGKVMIGLGDACNQQAMHGPFKWVRRDVDFAMNNIIAIAHNGFDRFIAGGIAGSFVVSSDGMNWEQGSARFGTTSILAAAYNGRDLWVVGGSTGKLATSPDAINWTLLDPGFRQSESAPGTMDSSARNFIYGIAFDGSSLWVAVGAYGKIMTSTDGVMWTRRKSGFGTTNIRAVAHNGSDLWVAAGGEGKLAVSRDGINWAQKKSAFRKQPVRALACNGSSLWVAGGHCGKLATSSDGVKWKPRNAGFGPSSILAVAHNREEMWVAGGEDGKLATSYDGIKWEPQESSFGSVAIRTIVHKEPDLWIAGGDFGTLATSNDGITWTHRKSNFNQNDIRAFDRDSRGLWVMTMNSGKIATSSDGINWVPRDSGFGMWNVLTVTHSPSGLWAVGGVHGKFATSPDGVNWTVRKICFGADHIQNIACSDSGLWLAVGNSGKVATSEDGINWTPRNSSFGSLDAYDVAHNGIDLWVAVGEYGRLATSPDGITWTQRTSCFSEKEDIYRVAHNGRDLWIAGGASGKISTSRDGINWTLQDAGFEDFIYDIAYNGSLWMAVGGKGKIATSADGITWMRHDIGFGETDARAIGYDDTGFWIVGGQLGKLATSG